MKLPSASATSASWRWTAGMRSGGQGRRRGGAGYLLVELVLALTIFSLSVLGIAQTLHMAIQTAGMLNRESEIRIGLRSFLEEVRRKPLAELTQTYVDQRLGVTFNSTAEELELKDRNGSLLRDLYKLRVAVTFDAEGEPREEAIEVYVYKTKTEERQQ